MLQNVGIKKKGLSENEMQYPIQLKEKAIIWN